MHHNLIARDRRIYNFEQSLGIHGNLLKSSGGATELGAMETPAATTGTLLQLWIYSAAQAILELESKPSVTTAVDQPTTNDSGLVANTKFVNSVFDFYFNQLKGNAPLALDTLQKIAAAIGNNSAIYTDFQAKLTKLVSVSALQQGSLLLASHSTVSAGEMLTLPTALTTKVDGMVVRFKPTATVIGATPTMLTSIPGDTAAPIGRSDGLAYRAGDITMGSWSLVQWNATAGKWELMNPYTGTILPYSSMTEVVTGAAVNKAVTPRDVSLAMKIMRDGTNLLHVKYAGTIANGIYGRELVYIRTAGVNAEGRDYRPGDTLTVSVDLSIDAAMLAAGQRAMLTIYTRNQTGSWVKSGVGYTSNLTTTRVSGTLVLPADAADMYDIGIGIYHQGTAAAPVTTSAASVGVVTYDNLQLEWGGVATPYQVGYAAPPTNLDTINEIAAALNNLGDAGNKLLAALQLKATLDNPTFTGAPKTPTPTTGDNSKAIANTEFVQTTLALAFAANAVGMASTTTQGKFLLATPADVHLTEVISGSSPTVGMSDLDVTLYPLNTWVSAFNSTSIFWGIPSATICAVVTISAGAIKVDHTTNCSIALGPYGNPLDGTAKSIGIVGAEPDVNLVLSTLKVNVGANANAVMTIGVSPITSDISYDPTTGYYYSVQGVAGTPVSWTNAKLQASNNQFNGLSGYLAVVTNATENAYVTALISGLAWLGASDAQTEGTWVWATGPYSGQAVSWTNWVSGEPNNSGGAENYLQLTPTSGLWNDLADGNSGVNYFVVKYGGPGATPLEQISKKFSLMAASNSPTDRAISSGLLSNVLATKAKLASPALLGSPRVPTAAAGDNSKAIANTEFVIRSLTSQTQTATALAAGFATLANLGDVPAADKALTPEIMAARLAAWKQTPDATETVVGLSTFATNQETLLGASSNEFVTPKAAKAAIDAAIANRQSTTVGAAPLVTIPNPIYCLKPFTLSMAATPPSGATHVTSFTLTLQPHSGSAWTATTETLTATNNAASVNKTFSVAQEGVVDIVVVANYNTGTSSQSFVSTLTATKVVISAPVITFPTANQTGVTHTPLVTFNASTLSAGTDTLVSMDYMITHQDGGVTVIDYAKNGDTSNLTTFQVPDGFLLPGKEHILSVRSNFATYGAGLWGSVTFTTSVNGGHSLIQILETPNPVLNGGYGFSVSMSQDGGVLVVGTKNEKKAYVYEWSAVTSSYALAATLSDTATDAANFKFGYVVRVSDDGSMIMVSRPYPYNAASLADATGKVGYIYTYKKENGAWTNKHKVTHSRDITAYGNTSYPIKLIQFGLYMDISGDGTTIAVGDYSNVFVLYKYAAATDSWTEFAPSPGLMNGSAYGHSFSLDKTGARVVVGAAGALNGTITTAGLVFVWKQTGTAIWALEGTLMPSVPYQGERFGFAIQVNSDATKMLVSAPSYSSNSKEGRLLLFTRPAAGTTWTQSTVYVYDSTTTLYGLGMSLTTTDDFGLIGAGHVPWLSSSGSTYVTADSTQYCQMAFFSMSGTTIDFLSAIPSPGQLDYSDAFGISTSFSGDGRRGATGASGYKLGSITTQGRVYIYNL